MRKRDIARRIHQVAGISETQAATLRDWILGFLKTTLQEGKSITISGVGKFMVRNKAPRSGRNFKIGEARIISARRVVTFHPSLVLTAEVNGVPARSLQ